MSGQSPAKFQCKVRIGLGTPKAFQIKRTGCARSLRFPTTRTRLRCEYGCVETGAIDADPHFTPKGKDGARVKAAKDALEALGKWHAPRLAGLDADLGTQRAALVPTGDKPDGRQIDFLLSHLRDKTLHEIAVLYNSTTDERRLLMEAASASVGDIPYKTEDGGVE
jgi:hypothetical protein